MTAYRKPPWPGNELAMQHGACTPRVLSLLSREAAEETATLAQQRPLTATEQRMARHGLAVLRRVRRLDEHLVDGLVTPEWRRCRSARLYCRLHALARKQLTPIADLVRERLEELAERAEKHVDVLEHRIDTELDGTLDDQEDDAERAHAVWLYERLHHELAAHLALLHSIGDRRDRKVTAARAQDAARRLAAKYGGGAA